jgi:hypothetical protein
MSTERRKLTRTRMLTHNIRPTPIPQSAHTLPPHTTAIHHEIHKCRTTELKTPRASQRDFPVMAHVPPSLRTPDPSKTTPQRYRTPQQGAAIDRVRSTNGRGLKTPHSNVKSTGDMERTHRTIPGEDPKRNERQPSSSSYISK